MPLTTTVSPVRRHPEGDSKGKNTHYIFQPMGLDCAKRPLHKQWINTIDVRKRWKRKNTADVEFLKSTIIGNSNSKML